MFGCIIAYFLCEVCVCLFCGVYGLLLRTVGCCAVVGCLVFVYVGWIVLICIVFDL